MEKIYLKLRFPLVALTLIALIYGSLLIIDLKNKTDKIQAQNQALNFKADELTGKLNQLQKDVVVIQDNNAILQTKLATAQSQISFLKNSTSLKQVLGTNTVIETKPAVATKVITRTVTKKVTQEVEKNQATVTISGVGSFKVDLQSGDNAFDVLKRASLNNSFPLDYDTYSFGVFVKSIGGIVPQGNQYWAFYFNGTFSNVGASDQPVQKGDSIFWQLASF